MRQPKSIHGIVGDDTNMLEAVRGELRMVKRPLLFVEGSSDRTFMKIMFRSNVHVKPWNFKSSALEAIDICKNQCKTYGYKQRALAIVDLDYDRIFNDVIEDSKWVMYVDVYNQESPSRDLEVMVFRSDALYKVLCKYDRESDSAHIRHQILSQAAYIGAADVFRQELPKTLTCRMKSWRKLDFEEFFNHESLTLNLSKFVDYAIGEQIYSRCPKDGIIRDIGEIYVKYSHTELARGHDVVRMLSAHVLGGFEEHKFLSIEAQLVTACEQSEFTSYEVIKRIQSFIDNGVKAASC